MIAAFFGVIALFFAAFIMLFCGIPGVVWLFRHWKRADGQDVVGVAMFILIGCISGYFAGRWIRSAGK